MRKTAKKTDPAATVMLGCLRLSRLVLIWERTWPFFWPVPSVAVLFLALVLLDVLPLLPGWLHGLILAALGFVPLRAAVALAGLRAPRPSEIRKRIEEDSGLSHRPLATLTDRQALGRDDPVAAGLWGAEKRRVQALLGGLKVSLPRPVMARHDPWGLRFYPWALLLIALIGPSGDFGSRLSRALSPTLPGLSIPKPLLQVWITPPAYTRIAPFLLDRLATTTVRIPEGSTLLAQLQGGKDAVLLMDRSRRAFEVMGPDSQRLETAITDAKRLSVRQSFRTVASWDIDMIHDGPPSVAWTGPPVAADNGRLLLPVSASDDYGITSLWLEIRAPDGQGQYGSKIDLLAGQERPKTVNLALLRDLTAERLAGLPVKLRLGAADDAGHETRSEEQDIVLPIRHFRHPVAQAVATERHNLIARLSPPQEVARRLRAMAWGYDAYRGDKLVFLCLIDASARLMFDPADESADSVVDLLWLTALRIEEGDGPIAKLGFEQAMQDLRNALSSNIDQAEIDRLVDQLKQAAERYLEALSAQAAGQDVRSWPLPPDAREISRAGLDAMLERLRDLSQTGSKDAAKRAMDELQSLLNGLDGSLRTMPSPEMARKARERLDELRTLERQQGELLDETFRLGRREAAPPEQRDGSALAQRQESLRRQLGNLMERLDEMGVDVPAALGDAVRAMGDAGKSLKGLEFDDAVEAEGDALTRLREGAGEAEKSLSGRMGGIGAGRDPLGRPGLGDDGSVAVPKQGDAAKARQVLDELRRRSGEGNRPLPEHDYLQRLLKGFY